ncbi:MAG TPA: SAM-dependent methyltransferase [Planctomycetota bacterium]|nr:SAM-dependent methyltransferase [Planctomycetota bacterium]
MKRDGPRRRPPRTQRGAPPGAADLPADPRLLRVLRLANADGSVSADARRKLNQVGRLLEIFDPWLADMAAAAAPPIVWDLNCGSSYLGLLLADRVRRNHRREIRLFGVDRDPARIDACRRRAADAGFPDATFVAAEAATARLPGPPDLVVSLHGCDVATDEALRQAVRGGARRVAVAPCCHRELRRLLRPQPPHDAFQRDGAVAQEYAALLTDVLRAEALRAAGYVADVIEFVPAEHTPRNRLLRGTATGRPDPRASEALRRGTAACERPPSFADLKAEGPPAARA